MPGDDPARPFHPGDAMRLHVELGRRLEAVCHEPTDGNYGELAAQVLMIAQECLVVFARLERHVQLSHPFDWRWPQ